MLSVPKQKSLRWLFSSAPFLKNSYIDLRALLNWNTILQCNMPLSSWITACVFAFAWLLYFYLLHYALQYASKTSVLSSSEGLPCGIEISGYLSRHKGRNCIFRAIVCLTPRDKLSGPLGVGTEGVECSHTIPVWTTWGHGKGFEFYSTPKGWAESYPAHAPRPQARWQQEEVLTLSMYKASKLTG